MKNAISARDFANAGFWRRISLNTAGFTPAIVSMARTMIETVLRGEVPCGGTEFPMILLT